MTAVGELVAEFSPDLEREVHRKQQVALRPRERSQREACIGRLGRLLNNIDAAGPEDEEIRELRRLLYGIYAVLQLHFAQEDEGYLSLVDEPSEL